MSEEWTDGKGSFMASYFLLIAVFLIDGIWRYIIGIYGLIRLLTGVFAFCPAYIPLKYNTRKSK